MNFHGKIVNCGREASNYWDNSTPDQNFEPEASGKFVEMITIFDIGGTIFHYKPVWVVKRGKFGFPEQKMLVENNGG